jgi:hypothetical protein
VSEDEPTPSPAMSGLLDVLHHLANGGQMPTAIEMMAKGATTGENNPSKSGICNNGHQMERREGMFFWRGDTRPGWVCPICNALWEISGEEIEPLRPTPADQASVLVPPEA